MLKFRFRDRRKIVNLLNRRQIVQRKVCDNASVSMRILFSAELPGSCDRLPGKRRNARFAMGVRWYGLGCQE